MNYERSVISEARLSSLIALTCVPVILMLAAILNGWGLEDSMYTRAFGPIVYIVFYGGLLYATYEFVDTIFKRKKYIFIEGGNIYIAHHHLIKISEVSDIYLENGFFSKNIIISKHDGRKTKIRVHLLSESPQTVLERLQEFRGHDT